MLDTLDPPLDTALVTEPVLARWQPDNFWRIVQNPTGTVLLETTDPHAAVQVRQPGDVMQRRYHHGSEVRWSDVIDYRALEQARLIREGVL